MTRGSDLNALSHLEVDVTELSEEGGPSLRECERMDAHFGQTDN